ncbi:DUF2171 domain-containing protein [Sphingomonas sp. Ag1]|jgi:hypothetical protein|uniref:DUF2171 domain-containing protein n=1 Tax=Sphingomonas sp. Ag1 TaxID=1642949 RepID=UPI00062258B0|nr:DUF2171 domain-containing protein [Sphingomonas sp. Ag1]KKI19049.1 hypothetical protein XM50_09820 [Sphingomonas sp. Ag1]
MVYDRNGRGDPAGREQDYGRDYGSGRDYTYSSARDYAAAGRLGRGGGGSTRRDRDDDSRDYVRDFVPYGERDYGHEGYSQRDRRYASYDDDNSTRDWGDGRRMSRDGDYYGAGERYGRSTYGQSRDSRWDRGQQGYGAGSGYGSWQGRDDYRGGGQGRGWGRDHDEHRRHEHQGRGRHRHGGGYAGMPQGYDYDERGFFARAGDEVRSWFGDEEAERRREEDMRLDERDYGDRYGSHRDSDYGSWRRSQIASLDRDYDEYRRENRSKFENEFSSWRTNRQTQRDSLNKVTEHMEVVGMDGSHVGTVDKVRGDRILLTKNDADAEGRHHSIPSSWLATVDTKVTLTKTADEAKKHWRDEENSSALFGYGDRTGDQNRDKTRTDGKDEGRTSLDRSFSGTY